MLQTNHLLAKHGITLVEYKRRFPDVLTLSLTTRRGMSNSHTGMKLTEHAYNRMRETTSSEGYLTMMRALGHARRHKLESKEKNRQSMLQRWGDDKYRQWMDDNKVSRGRNISRSLKGKQVGHPNYAGHGGGHCGIRPDLGFFLRSDPEANYARILRLTGVEFEYEKHRFYIVDENGKRVASYCPDFYLSESNLHVEFKGWMDPKSKWLIDTFRKQYPEIKLKVLMQDSDEWKQLTETYSKLIPEWETSKLHGHVLAQQQTE